MPPGSPTDCNPDELESTITAFVAADGSISDFDFEFQPGTQDVVIVGITCLTIVVTNETELTGQLGAPDANGDASLTISDVVVDVEIENPNFDPGCGLRGIEAGGLDGDVQDHNAHDAADDHCAGRRW